MWSLPRFSSCFSLLTVSPSHCHSEHILLRCLISLSAYQYHVLQSHVPPTLPNMAKGKSPAVDHAQQRIQETALEAESRKMAGFDDIERSLPKRWTVSEMGFLDKLTGHLGRRNPFYKPATPDKNTVILLDTVAYRPVHPYPHSPQPWQTEFVAAFFYKGRKDVGDVVSTIADTIGLDGDVGSNEEAKARIAERIQPFIDGIAPAKSVEIIIPQPTGAPIKKMLGPSNANGISSQTELTGGNDKSDGTNIVFSAPAFPDAKGHIHYAAPEGWGIISDVDDTIHNLLILTTKKFPSHQTKDNYACPTNPLKCSSISCGCSKIFHTCPGTPSNAFSNLACSFFFSILLTSVTFLI